MTERLRGGRGRRRLAGLLAVALPLAASLITGAAMAEPNVPPLAWQSPTELRVMRWAAGAQEAAVVREPSPSSAISLGKQELLVMPVDPGSRVRVSGGLVSAGLGSGHGSLPDTITWMSPDSSPRGEQAAVEIYVPPWSTARFLVLRTASEGAKIGVEMASRESVPLRWHRFDKQLADYFTGGPGEMFPLAPAADAEPLVRWLSAAEKALAGLPRGITTAWLMARWLEESYRVRPVVTPYFATRGLAVTWGRAVRGLPEIERASDWRALSPSPAVKVEGPFDVMRVAFSARRRGRSKIIVREGDAVARIIEWTVPARANEPDAWTDPEWFRFVIPAANPKISFEVVEGEVAVAMVAYRHQTDLLDAFAHRRDRGAWLGRVIESGPESLRRAAKLSATRSASALMEMRAVLSSAGVAGPLRALLLGEIARSAPDGLTAIASAAEALSQLDDAPPFVSGPIGRQILHHLEVIGAQGILGMPVAASHEDDAQAVASSLAALSPPVGAQAVRQALSDEMYARRHGEIPDAATRAHRTWVHETPWRVLDPAPGIAVRLLSRPVYSGVPGGATCPTRGAYGLRWTRLADPRTPIAVSAPSGAYARVTLRGDLDEAADIDTSVRIDGKEIAVHAASGLPSFLAIAPGEHVFERSSTASPVLARIPREGIAPCASLREMERWAKVERSASFPVGGIKEWTVAQFVVSLPGAERDARLKLNAGAVTYDVWVRSPASGRAEIPVSAAASSLSVETERPVELRAYVRAPAPIATPVAIAARPPQGDLEELLGRVRNATQRIRAGPLLVRGVAHADRRFALEALGYHRLAVLDAPPAPDLSESLELREGPAEAVTLPAGSGPIEPLGYVSRIGPLPSDDPYALARARGLFAAHDMPGTVVAIRDTAESRADASTLLLAVAAERAGLPQQAADALERIGLAHRSGAALAHAAALATDAALARQDKSATLRAFVLVQTAAEFGDPAAGAFGRLAPAIAWAYPARAESSAGFASVEALAKTDDVALSVRVRRAWVDAPDNAALLSEGTHIEMRVVRNARTTLTLKSHCDPLDQAASACAIVPTFDGEVVPCHPPRPGESASCTFSVPPGVHRLELRPPADREVMGWVIARDDSAQIDLPSRVVSDWVEIDAGRPLELAFAGPTVLRIDARSEAGVERRLGVTVVRGQETSFGQEWTPSGDHDDRAARVLRGGDRTNVTIATEKRIPVLSEGPHRLRIVSPDGRVLLRLAVARAVGLPRPRDEQIALVPSTNPGTDEPLPAPMPPVADDPTGFPLSFGATTLYVNSNIGHLGDAEQTRFSSLALSAYVEQQARLHREIVDNRAWVSMTALGRVRDGPTSWGFSPTFDASPAGYMPGVLVSSLTVLQSQDGHTAIGGNVTGLAYGAIPLSGTVRFLPWGAFTINPVDSAIRATKGADPDVYTLYNASHPRQASAGLRLAMRPYVDTILKAQASTRTQPDLNALDRAEGRFDIDALPGEGLAPWLGFTWHASYRLITADRPQAFLRNTFSARFTLWSWLGGQGHRISLAGALDALFDTPKGAFTQPPLSGVLSLAYDETGVRGVRDFPTRLVPFRGRQEEKSGRIHRAASPAEPSWWGGP